MSARLFLSLMWRQSRGSRGRLFFFGACIALGVTAVVGVGALVEAIETSLRAQSRELLGGDLELESRRPLPDPREHLPAAYQGLRQVDMTIVPTMVQNRAGDSRLAEVKAVDQSRDRFPLVGELRLQPARPLTEVLTDASVLVAPELARDLALSPGDRLRVGGHWFEVGAVLQQDPQRLEFSFAFGPRLLMTQAGLARTKLLGYGNRVRYRSILAFPQEPTSTELASAKSALTGTVPGAGTYVSVETHEEAQPALRSTLDRVQRFLGLVAALSLLMGCVGVAQIVSTWTAESAQRTAVLRCLGLRPRDVMAFQAGHVLLLAVVGSLAGASLGALMPWALARAYPDLFPLEVPLSLPMQSLGAGVALGVAVALLFSLPPLTAIWKVPPARALNSEADPLPIPAPVRYGAMALATLGIFVTALVQAQELMVAFAFTAGVMVLSALLVLGAVALQHGVGRLPRARLPAVLWQGAAALVRPGAGTTGGIVALGLGTLVMLSISLVEGILNEEVASALPTNAPTLFLADVQSDQWEDIQGLARDHGASALQSAPVVMARLSSVDGRPVRELMRERRAQSLTGRDVRWVFTREQRLTWSARLPDNNELVEGEVWADPALAEVSIEQGFARDLGVWVGSRLGFDVQGVPMEFTVTSVRKVEWRSFAPNFFLVMEPGFLEEAPGFRIGAMRLAEDSEQAFQDRLAQGYPNVTVVRVRHMITRVRGILDQVALGLRLLGAFAVLTGLLILISAVASTQLRRAREAALLKTLGLTRLRIAVLFAVEYALRGSVAGLLGAAGAYALAWAFTSQVLMLRSLPSPWLCLIFVAGTIALSMLGGLLASARALWVRPLQILR